LQLDGALAAAAVCPPSRYWAVGRDLAMLLALTPGAAARLEGADDFAEEVVQVARGLELWVQGLAPGVVPGGRGATLRRRRRGWLGVEGLPLGSAGSSRLEVLLWVA
jgi:hypothetical protein